jgi:hypothetical protein
VLKLNVAVGVRLVAAPVILLWVSTGLLSSLSSFVTVNELELFTGSWHLRLLTSLLTTLKFGMLFFYPNKSSGMFVSKYQMPLICES